MFSSYSIFIGNEHETFSLLYELERHRPAQEWARLMNLLTVDSLRLNFNPWHGLSRTSIEKVNRLNALIDLLNEWLPPDEKIPGHWDEKDPQNSLNRLHIHFPEHQKNEINSDRSLQLQEYNDTIHGLEDIIRLSATSKEYVWLLVLPDKGEKVALDDDDYKYFQPQRVFGELCLHYSHIGRHPLELLKARDFNCPIEQIVPQRLISPYHSLRFHDDATNEQYHTWFSRFYEKSMIKQMHDLGDPKMAFGFISMGKLISINGKVLNRNEILSVIKSTNKILGWKVQN